MYTMHKVYNVDGQPARYYGHTALLHQFKRLSDAVVIWIEEENSPRVTAFFEDTTTTPTK